MVVDASAMCEEKRNLRCEKRKRFTTHKSPSSPALAELCNRHNLESMEEWMQFAVCTDHAIYRSFMNYVYLPGVLAMSGENRSLKRFVHMPKLQVTKDIVPSGIARSHARP